MQHWLHVHGAIKLQHTRNYRLSNEKIRGVTEKILGKKVHFNTTESADVAITLKDTFVLVGCESQS
jgi:hypothetical protein